MISTILNESMVIRNFFIMTKERIEGNSNNFTRVTLHPKVHFVDLAQLKTIVPFEPDFK